MSPGKKNSSPQRVGRFKALLNTPNGLRRGLNAWPPFLFAGIHIVSINNDFTHIVVGLRHTPFTSNYVGTQFGGSLFAMTDPFWMLMMMRALGSRYVVWDKAGEIDFVAPAAGAVRAEFRLDPTVVTELIEAAASGAKVLRWFEVDITTPDGTLIARVRKQLYVRLAA